MSTSNTGIVLAIPTWDGGLVPYVRTLTATLALPILAIGLQVGTGGAPTKSYYLERGTRGYSLANYDLDALSKHRPGDPTPGENLARVREVLKPTMTELARVLNVSRQAIYDWQSGASITAENAAKLASLARAADVFAAEGLTTTNQILRRQIAGRSFFDKVRDGELAEDAARLLLNIARRELEQRQALADRLKDRRPSVISTEDIGVPHLNEQG